MCNFMIQKWLLLWEKYDERMIDWASGGMVCICICTYIRDEIGQNHTHLFSPQRIEFRLLIALRLR